MQNCKIEVRALISILKGSILIFCPICWLPQTHIFLAQVLAVQEKYSIDIFSAIDFRAN